MPFIEAPTTFYMGRRYDPQSKRLMDDVVYYDSRDLTTHAVVVGMTGSGKTGLCITLLEEAILDNIPAIIIDPKGDITNLLLTFPDMRPEDFLPWINQDEARRAGLESEEYAADVADRWKSGLQAWGIVPDRVRWMQNAAQYSIYTPGSDAGLPISILDAMQAPREGWLPGTEEFHRERISAVVTALLALIGKQVDPVKDREHILIANIFEYAWRQGIDLTLEDVIIQVKQPPFAKLGVFDIDTFFPEKDRFKLAMELNNIIAAPSFQSWINGEPLDVRGLLYQPDGRPKISIFYIAHLNEAERQFIITLILENMLSWMRTLSGTSSLRALLYIDEVFGLFPPYPKNPPTKAPILKLLKQARAFGIGLVLATQNPGDLDYKGLSNAGTWFIGKLQTENDRKKILTGLEAMADAQSGLNLRQVKDLIGQIDPRVFLMHNVHDEGGPLLMHTRWAMSYLCGPLTRIQIGQLMAPQRQQMQYYQPQQGFGYGSSGYAPPGPGQTQPVPGYPTAPQTPYPQQPGYAQQPQHTPPPAVPPNLPPGAIPPPMNLPEMPGSQPTPPPQRSLPPQYTPQLPYTAPPNQYAPPPQQGGLFQGGQTQGTVSRTGGSQITRDTGLPPGYSYNAPGLPSAITQYFLPGSIPIKTALANWEQRTGFQVQGFNGAHLLYKPVLLAQAAARYQDRKSEVNAVRQYAYHIPDVQKTGIVYWENYIAPPIDVQSLSREALDEAIYAEIAPGMNDEKRLKALEKEVVDQIYHSQSMLLLFSPTLKIYGDPDMSRRDFRAKLENIVREKRDEEIDKVTQNFEKELDRMEDKLRDEIRELDATEQELADRRREQLFTGGEAFMSLFKGRTTYTLSRYSRAQRYTRQTRADIEDSEAEIQELQNDMDSKIQEMERALQQVNEKWGQVAAEAEEYRINPLKKNIQMELFGITWLPYWFTVLNNNPVLLPAHPVAGRRNPAE